MSSPPGPRVLGSPPPVPPPIPRPRSRPDPRGLDRPGWPARGAVCRDCRTAVAEGSTCPAGPGHRVCSLGDASGRDAILTEVWGPLELRRRIGEAARAGATGGGGASLLDGCSLSDCGGGGGDLGDIVLIALAVFAAVFVLWLVASLAVAAVRAWRRRPPRPRGARRAPAAVGPPTGRVGTIAAGVDRVASDPVTGRGAVAFALELTHVSGWRRRRSAMLRDAATVGFEVLLDGGERVRIPAGPCLVDLDGASTSRAPLARVAAYLAALDPARATADDLDPFPFHQARHLILRPGQRVEVRGRLLAVPDPRAAPAGYREPARALLVPDGVPRLAVIDRSRRGSGRRSPG
ncbi:MAG TPA: hypothetical protein VK698_31770 [Kofleriaceae bacterium]|nr:hypothetical protein [Kofleriaceae bacterium]